MKYIYIYIYACVCVLKAAIYACSFYSFLYMFFPYSAIRDVVILVAHLALGYGCRLPKCHRLFRR